MNENTKAMIIAVDGFSSCGKSTFAKAVAARLGYAYIDTGAMYRAVTLFAMQNGLICDNSVDVSALTGRLDDIDIRFKRNADTGQNETWLNGQCVERDIRSLTVSEHVSEVSAVRAVRKKLVALQQDMGRAKAVVLDGRDIGTIVFPDADVKIFMTAREEVRVQRRYDEMTAKGITASHDEIAANIAHRDYLDQHRAEDPLRQAADAIVLDNSDMTIDDEIKWFERQIA